MFRSSLLIAFYLLLFSFLHSSEEGDPFTSSLVNKQNLLPTTVQSISVITGEWLESEVDFIVPGHDPLVLTRSYAADYSHGRLGYNWEFNQLNDLTVSIEKSGQKNLYRAYVHHSSGIKTLHRARSSDHAISMSVSCTKGLTNCSSDEISGRTNLHNLFLNVNKNDDTADVTSGSGQVTHYKLDEKDSDHLHYLPKHEKKANGNMLIFRDRKIVSKNHDESVLFGHIIIHPVKREKVEVYASDGKSATYTFDSYEYRKPLRNPYPEQFMPQNPLERHRYCLIKASYTHKPDIEYEYEHADRSIHAAVSNPFLKKKFVAGNYVQGVTYYHKGKNSIKGVDTIEISDKDFRIHRIKEVKAPVGHDGTPVVTHRFVYSDYKKEKYQEIFTRKTKVYDAYLNTTVYTYNRKHRPISITRYTKNAERYTKENFVWDEGTELNLSAEAESQKEIFPVDLIAGISSHSSEENLLKYGHISKKKKHKGAPFKSKHHKPSKPKSLHQKAPEPKPEKIMAPAEIQTSAPKNPSPHSSVGNLIGKYLSYSHGQIAHALFFDYDSKGNIVKESYFGNLSGTCQIPIQLNENKIPQINGCEYYQKEFTYSNDQFNHLLTEKEDNGKEIEYVYDPHTNQVAAKYIKDHGHIQLRQFFYYDPHTAALVKVIKDDGSDPSVDNLSNLTERKITEITPKGDFPVGLPTVIQEKYFKDGQEILLKRIECHYDSSGKLCRQDYFDAHLLSCYSLTWAYDSYGNVIEETDALGHRITRKYNKRNLLKSETGPRPQDITEYEYDWANRLIQVTHSFDGATLVTQHNYDLKNNLIATIDPFGEKTTYEYDEFNRLTRTIHPPILLREDWIFTPTEEILEYNVDDHPKKIRDASGYITLITYNSRGKPILKTHPDGTIEHFEYYLDGTLAKAIAPNGTSTNYKRDYLGRTILEETFDAQHQLVSSQTFTYKGSKLISKLDPENCLTTYAYDSAGRLIAETSGNASKNISYDTMGRINQITTWFGFQPHESSVQTFIYDNLDQVIQETLQDANGNILQRISYTYDELGNKTSIKRELENGESLTRAEYQADGKPVKIIDALGHATHFTYDYNHYNSINQYVLKTTQTDPLGRTTISISDTLGRAREIATYDPFGTLLAKQEIDYDPVGRKIKTKDAVIIDGTVHRETINAWSYHPSGQENVIHEAAGTPEQRFTYLYYNAHGQKEKMVKPNGIELYYTYDSLGRLKTLNSSDNSISYTYTYNLRHEVISVTDHKNQQTTTRTYDNEGNLKQEILGNSLTLSYQYDRMGRVTHLTLPDQSSASYLYNAANLKEIHRHKNGQLQYCHQQYRHDPSGNLLQSKLIGNAGEIHYSYDSLGRVCQINNAHWRLHIPPEGYDSTGRLTKKVTHDPSGIKEVSFAYNDLDHLQTETGDTSYSYQTDSLHNRLRKNHQQCHNNTLNQLVQDGDFHYNYDRNGNLLEKSKENQKTTYTYDALGRLIAVSSAEGTTTYLYDPFHRRITKNHRGVLSHYLYQGENEIGCADSQGTITELRLLGIGIDAEIGAAIALELQGKTYAPIHDNQGNIVCLIDAETGTPSETYRYSAFGEEKIFNAQGLPVSYSQPGNPWRFAAKRKDSETGWIHFGRRYYDPENGRWTTPDPIGFEDGPNLYAYLHHNPLNAYDAYGLLSIGSKVAREAAENCARYANASVFSDLGRPELGNDHQRSEYISGALSNVGHAAAGIAHGGVDYAVNQCCLVTCIACTIGSGDMDDSWEERKSFQEAYERSQSAHVDNLNGYIVKGLGVDPKNSVYQNCCSYTTTALEVGSVVAGGYGLVKGGIAAVNIARTSARGAQIAGKIAKHELKSVAKEGVRKLKSNQAKQLLEGFENFLGKNSIVSKPQMGSDLILRSKDGYKQIRFDLSNPHGLDPHINIETFRPRNLYPGDQRMIRIENIHVFPRKI